MQIILNDQSRQMVIDKAVRSLSKGGIVIYPADTVYGIAVDATNQGALLRLDKLKDRRSNQKYSFNFASIEMVKNLCDLSADQISTIRKYLPGPYTFVISPEVSIRIPKNTIITEIVKEFGKPVTATSANITGKNPATCTRTLDAKLYLAADLIIEQPDFEACAPSTIVDLSTPEHKVIRQGASKFP